MQNLNLMARLIGTLHVPKAMLNPPQFLAKATPKHPYIGVKELSPIITGQLLHLTGTVSTFQFQVL
jgi:hypothetical protein